MGTIEKVFGDLGQEHEGRRQAAFVLGKWCCVRPTQMVAEVKFLTWTDDNLLRQVVYEGLREDKPASEVRREVPHPNR
jgi:ATP-dependent DNA ligase